MDKKCGLDVMSGGTGGFGCNDLLRCTRGGRPDLVVTAVPAAAAALPLSVNAAVAEATPVNWLVVVVEAPSGLLDDRMAVLVAAGADAMRPDNMDGLGMLEAVALWDFWAKKASSFFSSS